MRALLKRPLSPSVLRQGRLPGRRTSRRGRPVTPEEQGREWKRQFQFPSRCRKLPHSWARVASISGCGWGISSCNGFPLFSLPTVLFLLPNPSQSLGSGGMAEWLLGMCVVLSLSLSTWVSRKPQKLDVSFLTVLMNSFDSFLEL